MQISLWFVDVFDVQWDDEPAPNDVINVPTIILNPPTSNTNGQVFGIVPSGLINGSNATFTTPDSFIPETVQLFRNGLSQYNPTHFYTTGTHTIILNFSPIVGDILTVNYYKT